MTEKRIESALAAIKRASTILSTDQAFEVFYELGLDEGVSFNDEHQLQLDLTELQYVAAAAGLSAAAESRGKQVLNEYVQQP